MGDRLLTEHRKARIKASGHHRKVLILRGAHEDRFDFPGGQQHVQIGEEAHPGRQPTLHIGIQVATCHEFCFGNRVQDLDMD